uniref:PKD domain-containing protein n=1 Tax=Cyclopterus lumpus TaxID=8103 RepID=A0A8C3FYB1_CYCLU
GFITKSLVFYQMEGNATYVRDTGELASDVPTETMFELFDPQNNFSTAKFTYTWDLGNGQVIQGTEPVVRYHYAESGNYTLRLKVGVNVTKYSPPITPRMSKSSVCNKTHLIFILSCAAILVATFSFIVVIACRPRQRDRSQNQDSEGQSAIVFNFSNVERGEKEPLLLQYGPQYWSQASHCSL